MDQQIVTVGYVQERARRAFVDGLDLSDNPFPWHSAAYRTWEKEWMRLAILDTHLDQLAMMNRAAPAALDVAQEVD